MITGDDARAVVTCDAPGCKALIEMTRVESHAPAVADIWRIAVQYYGWHAATREPGYGNRHAERLHICPEHA